MPFLLFILFFWQASLSALSYTINLANSRIKIECYQVTVARVNQEEEENEDVEYISKSSSHQWRILENTLLRILLSVVSCAECDGAPHE